MTVETTSEESAPTRPAARQQPVGWTQALTTSGVSLVAALGAGSLAAAVLDADSPMTTVGRRVISNVPRWLKDFAIAAFGTADKAVLGLCMVIGMTVLGALLVRTAGNDRSRLAMGVGVLVLIGLAAAASGRDPGAGDYAAVVIAGAVAVASLSWLCAPAAPSRGRRRAGGHRPLVPNPVQRTAPSPDADPPAEPTARRVVPIPRNRWEVAVDRRAFVTRAGALSAVGVTAGIIGSSVNRSATDSLRTEAASKLPVPRPGSPDAAAVVTPDASVGGGVEPFITPNADWYRIDTVPFSSPRVDLDTWRLTIGGNVDRELSLSFADLLDRHIVERVITLCCVSNEVGGDLISTARFLGVPLAELLEEAGPRTGGEQIAMTSVDGWTCGFPTKLALDGRDALLAIGMNGEPLPVDHGFPARVVVPGLYGYVSATKWITEIRLTGWNDFDGYWMDKGWSKEGPIKTQSRIDVPRSGTTIAAGDMTIAGIAWAQHTGIEKVEISIDRGRWVEARLADEVSVDAWRQWSYRWRDAPPGDHEVRVRATDRSGETQTDEVAPVAPDGATGWHRRRFTLA